MDKDERLGIIRRYFSLGLKYNDIVDVLLRRHNIEISRRQLIRVLHSNGLHRRKCDDILDAVDFIIKQQESSGALHGYRWMFEKCKTLGLRIYKEEVRCLLSVINPENVALRQRHRLRRRQYSAKGPNFIWHMDSYDKLKPFGICINGCIDGFSRKIVWLNAYFTSSDPALIGSYFIDSVQKLGGCPMIVRADMGTENTVVCELQRFLREDDDDSFQGDKSFLYGKSSCNQRIECWWGMLRKECADFWIDMFKKLRDDGDFDGTFADQNLILFCFLHIVQVCKLQSPAFVIYQHFLATLALAGIVNPYLYFNNSLIDHCVPLCWYFTSCMLTLPYNL